MKEIQTIVLRYFAFIVPLLIIIFVLPASANNVVLKAHGGTFPTYPKPKQSKDAMQNALIKKGEYLVKMGDCISCHTNTKGKGKPFSGGLPMKTPFGTLYTPNITPDRITGIGKWTKKDFVDAVRLGTSPAGHNYYPALPFVDFNKVSDGDLDAIRAYLNSIPAVHFRPPANQMSFPFNLRFMLSGWRMLFFDFDKGRFKPNPKRSAQWNRGAYIVKGLAHCDMCHTPRNPLGAKKMSEWLGGGFVDGFYAPNITSVTLAKLPTKEIIEVFTKEKKLGNTGVVSGPMEAVDHNSLQYMNPKDLLAIATYLKTVPPVVKEAKSMSGSALEIGENIYEGKCSVCHNTGAAGAPKLGDVDDWKPRIKEGLKTLHKHAIEGFNSMPAMGTCMTCTQQQIKDAVLYIVSNSKPGSAKKVRITRTAPVLPNMSITLGKKIYAKACSNCHAKESSHSGSKNAPKTGDSKIWGTLVAQGIDNLFIHSINGYKTMPAKGGCKKCTDAEVQAAVKYMVNKSIPHRDVSLW